VDLLYLTGFMGTGKSAVGPLVARALGYTYVDLDREVERTAGMSVPDIFAREGEATFRHRETEALNAVSQRDRCVVATGGGVVIAAANRARMARTGHVVCLTASPAAIVRRTGRGRRRRPLLAGEGSLEARVRNLLAERAVYYRECHHMVDTTGRPVAAVAKEIVKLHREGAWRR
jgi:shikimate kinase